MPAPDVRLREILKFRTKHRAELLALRLELDQVQSRISNCADEKEIRSEVLKLKQRIELESLRLQKALKSSRISSVLGSIQAFFRPGTPTIVGAAAVLSSQAILGAPLPVSWLVASAGGVGLFSVAAHMVKTTQERTAQLDKTPFAYLFLAQRRFSMARQISE